MTNKSKLKKLIFVPIELLEERYSLQWHIWFQNCFQHYDYKIYTVLPESGINNIVARGEFLDVITTNHFKAEQLQTLCKLIDAGTIDQDTTILFMDAWFPGLEMLAYMRDGLRNPFKLVGMFHAGTWDEHDFLYRKGMRSWARHIESGWMELLDGICVATNFHKDLILRNTLRSPYGDNLADKIHVTGFPVYPTFVNTELKKQNTVVFPHRIAPEKQPESFVKLTEKLYNHQFSTKESDYLAIRTKYYATNKQMYYNLLNQAKIAVSFALQETFGIAMIESVLCGCLPIVPDRLSYAELYPTEFKYPSLDNEEDEINLVFERVKTFIKHEKFFQLTLKDLQSRFIDLGCKAIPNILEICERVHDERERA